MKTSLFLSSFLILSPLQGQIAGAYETFTEAENADSWNFYDYSTGNVTAPLWTLPGSTDPEIYATFVADNGVSLYASSITSDQYFIGDYTSAGVAGVSCDVYVAVPANLDTFEFYFFSGGEFYYSNYFYIDVAGWSSAENSFKDNDWYRYNSVTGDYDYTPITDAILSDISEIGLNFFPISTAANGQAVGIDNFTLLADISPVEPTLKLNSGEGSLSFDGVPGVTYTIYQGTTLEDDDWTSIDTPFPVTGPYSYFFTAPSKKFFQITKTAFYTEVPKVDPL